MQFKINRYFPPGPIAAAFIREPAGYIRGRDDGTIDVVGTIAPFILGPVGSGKTNAMIFKALRHVAMLPPVKRGWIEAKGVFIRQDYRTLYKTFLPTWLGWFPKDVYKGFTGGQDRPAQHDLDFTTPRGRKIHLLVEFMALGDNRIEDVLRGWEGTFAGLNEADLMQRTALTFLLQRIPRWPRAKDIMHDVELPTLVMGDLNAPGDPASYVVEDFINEPKPGYKLFRQRGGLEAGAENVDNLPGKRNYYVRLAATMDDWEKHRFVDAKIGYDRSGLPVYRDFDPNLNISAEKLSPIPGVGISIGLDGYLHPAAVICQRAPNLQVRILKEIYLGHIGPTRFGEHLAAVLRDEFPDCPVIAIYYDPSADYGADKEGGEYSWIEIIGKSVGADIPKIPAWSNEIPVRVEAVRNLMVFAITADIRGLIADPRCTWIIRGWSGKYRYRLTDQGQVINAQAPRPEKNEFANVQDALQYDILGIVGRAGVLQTAAKGFRPGSVIAPSASNRILTSEFSV